MLVLCIGMYRACSTWQYGVASAILERHRAVRRLGFIDGGPFASDLEPGLDPESWYILKAHDAHEHYADALAGGRALAIYSHRDLRDVTFSWMHKTGADFGEILARGFLDRCLRNDRFWRSQPGMLHQTYEQLIAEPVRGVAEIAEHLGVALDEGEAESIASAYSLEANRKRTAELAERMVARGVALSSRDQDSYDPASLLHWNHLRTGQVGDWRERATPEQRATLARICGPWLVENGYEVDDSWAGLPESDRAKEADPLPRVSYAENAEDILLDRLFRGQSGTHLSIGSPLPTSRNPTYFFYLRGWRGVNVDPRSKARELLESGRPGDYNLALALGEEPGEATVYESPDSETPIALSPELAAEYRAQGRTVVERRVPVRTVGSLAEQYRLEPPDLCAIQGAEDVGPILRGIALQAWRPRAFVIRAVRPMTGEPCHEGWEPILLGQGYRLGASDGVNRYYLRDDLADLLPLLAAPVNSLDRFERSDLFEQRDRAESIARRWGEEHARFEADRARLDQEARHYREQAAHQASLRVEERTNALNDLARERDSWQRERDSGQRERDSRQVERDSRQVERDGTQVERDAVQRERDSVQRERDAFQRERDGWNAARDGLMSERAQLMVEAERANRLANHLGDEIARLRDAAAREEAAAEEVRSQLEAAHEFDRRAFDLERAAWQAERARWADELSAERAAREADRLEAERRATEALALASIPPERLIDRLGVVTALHRRATRSRREVKSKN